MSDVTIPEDVMAAAVATQNAAIERCLKAKLAASEYPYASGAAKEALDEEIACAILAERERCAGIAETHPKHRFGGWSGNPTCHAIAKAIRDGSIGAALSQPNDEGERK